MSIDYFSHKISASLVIDGDLAKPEWLAANWSPRFIDMASGEAAIGTEEEIMAQFRATRDEVRWRVVELLQELGVPVQ